MTKFYFAAMEPSLDGFSVFFPDVPGCASSGVTLRDAAINAQEALQCHLELTLESGFPVPEPRGDMAFSADPDAEVACYVLVRVDLPEYSVAA